MYYKLLVRIDILDISNTGCPKMINNNLRGCFYYKNQYILIPFWQKLKINNNTGCQHYFFNYFFAVSRNFLFLTIIFIILVIAFLVQTWSKLFNSKRLKLAVIFRFSHSTFLYVTILKFFWHKCVTKNIKISKKGPLVTLR